MMRQLLLGVIGAALALGVLCPNLAWAKRDLDLTRVAAYDPVAGAGTEVTRFIWPTQESAGFAMDYRTAGYTGSEEVRAFAVLQTSKGDVVFKQEQQTRVKAGDHRLVLDRRLDTSTIFGDTPLELKVELVVGDGPRVKGAVKFSVLGAPVPKIGIGEIELWNPNREPDRGKVRETSDKIERKVKEGIEDVLGGGGENSTEKETVFLPGDEFRLQTTFEVEDNQTKNPPVVYVMVVMMEKEEWPCEPFSGGLTDAEYWDTLRLEQRDGQWLLTADGYLPQLFQFADKKAQYFKVLVWAVFGPGAMEMATVKGKIQRPDDGYKVGVHKEDRMIVLDRAQDWEVEHE